MKILILFGLFFSTSFLYADINKESNTISLEKFLARKSSKLNYNNPTKSKQNVVSNYSINDYNHNINSRNKIHTKSKNYKISKRNLNLIINTNKNISNKSIFKKDTMNLILESQFRLFDYLNLKSKTGFKLNTNTDYIVGFDYNKVWKNIYNIDYIIGQSVMESLTNKLDLKHFIKLDKKLNEYYSIHNYYEYNLEVKNENVVNMHSYISLKQKLNSDELLVYKVVLNNNDENTSYGINIRYKLTNIVL
ncbi:MAG: hypothetical protein PHG81_07815 [Aliarcobacter sp.]|nr:hypothetical protein [Aliarcobacter sp.]